MRTDNTDLLIRNAVSSVSITEDQTNQILHAVRKPPVRQFRYTSVLLIMAAVIIVFAASLNRPGHEVPAATDTERSDPITEIHWNSLLSNASTDSFSLMDQMREEEPAAFAVPLQELLQAWALPAYPNQTIHCRNTENMCYAICTDNEKELTIQVYASDPYSDRTPVPVKSLIDDQPVILYRGEGNQYKAELQSGEYWVVLQTYNYTENDLFDMIRSILRNQP